MPGNIRGTTPRRPGDFSGQQYRRDHVRLEEKRIAQQREQEERARQEMLERDFKGYLREEEIQKAMHVPGALGEEVIDYAADPSGNTRFYIERTGQ
jgi:hypothetical protein